MAWTLGTYDSDKADLYFNPRTHPRAKAWQEFDGADREAATAYAERQIYQYIGYELPEPSDIEATDLYRPDYAIYEQAFFILVKNRQYANGDLSGIKYIDADDDTSQAIEAGFPLAPDAMGWLRENRGQPEIVRG